LIAVYLAAAVAHDSSADATERAADDRCAALASLRTNQLDIEKAVSQSAGATVDGAVILNPMRPGFAAPIAGLPAFCRVIGRIHPEPGSDIRFEVWMPSDWDGRLKGAGNGGFAGSISYAELAATVRAGEVGVSTDTGHQDPDQLDSSWARGHPELIRDYGWRAVHLSTVAAKQFVAKFYGKSPDFSYFESCSNGGRQALMEAARFPADYDGIMAGAPAAVWTDLILAMVWTTQSQLPPGATIRSEQAELLQTEVVRQCDALDGQTDGLVSDPPKCKFDPSRLACGVSDLSQCFTPPQLEALRKIQAGPRDVSGRQLAAVYPPSGAEASKPSPYFGWGGWIFNTGERPSPHSVFAEGFLKNVVQKPFTDVAGFDFNRDPSRLKAAIGADMDVPPDMRRFFDRGGKLIIWHGWADPAVTPQITLNFHQAILSKSGPRAKDAMRLFMVPGVQHCGGGPGPSDIGQSGVPSPNESPERSLTAALRAWVEKGRTPNSVAGRVGPAGFMPGQTPSVAFAREQKERLICAYPAMAVLETGVDPDKASSYVCK
jgi:feruloyl esterase